MQLVQIPRDAVPQLHAGVCAEASAQVTGAVLKNIEGVSWVVCLDQKTALRLASELITFLPRERIFYLPEFDEGLSQADMEEREAVFAHLWESKEGQASFATVVISSLTAVFDPVPHVERWSEKRKSIAVGDRVSFSRLKEWLAEMGYYCEAVCEETGQYAVRGGLLDVFPRQASEPYRIDFFGDEVEDIRTFDPATQKSIRAVPSLSLYPIETEKEVSYGFDLAAYLPTHMNWVLLDSAAQFDRFISYFMQPERIEAVEPGWARYLKNRAEQDVFFLLERGMAGALPFAPQEEMDWESTSLENFREYPEEGLLGEDRKKSEERCRYQFLRKLHELQEVGHEIRLYLNQEGDRDRLQEILSAEKDLQAFTPRFCSGSLWDGYCIRKMDTKQKLIFAVTEHELFGRKGKNAGYARRKKHVSPVRIDKMLDFSELAVGDYVVHLAHGIGIFRGLTKFQDGAEERDVISLEFANNLTLHVPLSDTHLLSRYVGLSKVQPKLGKVGGKTWQKTKDAAAASAMDYAADLLRLQAVRKMEQGHIFSPDTLWQKEFEDSFPFKETPDQVTAIRAVKEDMERAQPMDRLVCGDVGFGKTEVALRAAFKAVMDGKQVAFLSPTTVLAQQHWKNISSRMGEYPIRVEMLSRFRTAKQSKEILAQVRAGKIDVLVGTHRLLSKDVSFADLGLLIVDEEQRFGVRDKEKIKNIKTSVDVLTLSATPIPRTLYSALVGLRNLSVIETAPQQRLPIETVVREYDEKLVVQAVKREINRGGQAFYLHNRVKTIHRMADKLQKLMPEVRIGIGHGQMNEGELESTMSDFIDGRYDLFVCTTIIESGLDIPNCNTIIIEGADRFGLAQLYQLRGRVGRFNRQAYAYLFLHPTAVTEDKAKKRLMTLKQYQHLGAGYRIALRDLELRGAGNLLGEEQSGHIAGVGFEMYCQLLQESIEQLKGTGTVMQSRCRVHLSFISKGETDEASALKIAAVIPVNYLEEPKLRIDFYRRISMAKDEKALEEIAAEMVDRFGKYPREVEALLLVNRIRICGDQLGLQLIDNKQDKLQCQFLPGREQTYLMQGNRFPRLQEHTAMKRLAEIIRFLKRVEVE